jgi:hypothetical protein
MVSLFARFVGTRTTTRQLRSSSTESFRDSPFKRQRADYSAQIWSFLNLQQGRVGEMTSLSWGFLPEGTNGSLISRCNEEEFKRAFILLKYLLAETNGR